MPENDPIVSERLKLSEVSFGYKRHNRVISDLSIAFDHEATVIIGPNGAGKSTLLRLISGQLTPDDGTVQGTVAVGYCPQRVVALRAFTVREQVEYASWLGGVARRDAPASAVKAIEMVGLTDKGGSPATSLSGGQVARLGIACALAVDPPVVVLDEPSASLDPVSRSSVSTVLRDLAASGVTIIVSSHTAADVGPAFDRLLMMDTGTVIFDGSPEEFLVQPHTHPTAVEFAKALGRG